MANKNKNELQLLTLDEQLKKEKKEREKALADDYAHATEWLEQTLKDLKVLSQSERKGLNKVQKRKLSKAAANKKLLDAWNSRNK